MAETGTIIHASAEISLDPNKTTAFLTMNAPENGGMDITYEKVMKAISDAGVTYGINESDIRKAVEQKRYGENIFAARWTTPVDGKDGTVKWHFDKDAVIAPQADEAGNVDYKNLGIVQNILKGTIIATITPPTEGTPGKDITGMTVAQRVGVPAKINVGKGTALANNDLELVATIDGNLRFDKGSFVVEEELTIQGDVDNAVGNLDFIGNIIIRGNVLEGFTIHSNKNISINGTVTGAKVNAEGDLTIKLGAINSDITCGGSIKMGFCENTTVHAERDVEAASFVGGEVFAGKYIRTNGKGRMVGGKYTALEGIEAGTIGSDNYTRTLITVGNNAILSEERDNAMRTIAELEDKCEQLGKIISMLTEMAKKAKLPPEREQMKLNAMKSKFQMTGEMKRLEARIVEIDHTLELHQNLSVSASREFYPGTTLRINSCVYQVNAMTAHSRAAIDGGEIVMKPL